MNIDKTFSVIFDMDGVIIDNSDYHKKAWKKFCLKYNFNLSEEEMKTFVYGRINKDTLEYLFKKKLTKEEIDKYGEEKELIYRETYKPFIKPVDGIIDFFKMLKSNNIKMMIATSASPKNLEFVLSNIKIRDFFETIIDESSVTNGKPNPEIYLKAADALNIKPKNCIVVEDSLSGVKAGISTGMKVIGITSTQTEQELKSVNTNLIINHFSELTFEKIKELV